jgi:hypothetical protein
MNIFEQETRELVQRVEDYGHGSMSNNYGLHRALRNEMEALLDKVCLYYNLPKMMVLCYVDGSYVLHLKTGMGQESRDVLEREEPVLHTVLSCDSMCVCQAIPGIRHSHGD